MFDFFFSSRRRHTRCSRDWSSDVCSSDLVCTLPAGFQTGRVVLTSLILVEPGSPTLRFLTGLHKSKESVVCKAAFSEKRSEEHTSELQSRLHTVCRLLLEKTNRHTATRRAMTR